nr:nonstructural protein P3 [Onyong-nyong virus]
APSYRVKRMDIAKNTEECVVNAANPRGVPGDGVCKAVYRKWPESFRNSATPVGTAKTIMCGQYPVIHAVGPNFSNYSEAEGDRELASVYREVAKEVSRLGVSSVAIPLLSTGVYSGGKDRLLQSLNHLFAAMDSTDADVVIYCRDKEWEKKITEAISLRSQVELLDDHISVDCDIVRVHPDSSLAGRKGYSTVEGALYSYLEGTRFHQTAVDMAEIYTMWPKQTEANEQVCLYALGESIESVRQKCPVDDADASFPPKTVPCLCRYAMTPERVARLRMNHTTSIIVCSSFPLPKYKIEGVQKVKCSKALLFDHNVPSRVSPRTYRPADEIIQTPQTPTEACQDAQLVQSINDEAVPVPSDLEACDATMDWPSIGTVSTRQRHDSSDSEYSGSRSNIQLVTADVHAPMYAHSLASSGGSMLSLSSEPAQNGTMILLDSEDTDSISRVSTPIAPPRRRLGRTINVTCDEREGKILPMASDRFFTAKPYTVALSVSTADMTVYPIQAPLGLIPPPTLEPITFGDFAEGEIDNLLTGALTFGDFEPGEVEELTDSEWSTCSDTDEELRLDRAGG